MRWLSLGLLVLLGAGCPTPARYAFSIDVRSGGRPVDGAVVAMVCPPGGVSLRSDEEGRVQFKTTDAKAVERCRVVAGKPGFSTAEARTIRVCPLLAACPVVAMELVEREGAAAPGAAEAEAAAAAAAPAPSEVAQ
jgi:hypothetical protein